MKQKTLYYLAGIFVALVLIYFITKPRFATTNIDEITQSIVIGVSLEDVRSIDVYKEKDEKKIELRFVKSEDRWTIPTHFNCKGSKNTIEQLTKDILEMQGKVRATGENLFEQFKIHDHLGIHVILKDEADKALANLIVGKKGEDYGTSFVRFAGKDKIFFADKNVLSSLKIYGDVDTVTTFKTTSFVDLTAVNFDKDELVTIGLVKDGKGITLKKEEREVEVEKAESDTTDKEPEKKIEKYWVITEPRRIEIDQKEVDKCLNDIRTIKGQKVVDRIGNSLADLEKNSKYGFNRPRSYVVYFKEGGERTNAIFGKQYEKDKGYYFENANDGLVYEVTKYNYDKIFKWIEDLPEKKVEKK